MKRFFLLLALLFFLSCKSHFVIPEGAKPDEYTPKPPSEIDYYTYETVVSSSEIAGIDRQMAETEALGGLITNIFNSISKEAQEVIIRNTNKGKSLTDEQQKKFESVIKSAQSSILSCQIFRVSLRSSKNLYLRLTVSRRGADEIAKVAVYKKLINEGFENLEEDLENLLQEIKSDDWKNKKEKEIETLKKWEKEINDILVNKLKSKK